LDHLAHPRASMHCRVKNRTSFDLLTEKKLHRLSDSHYPQGSALIIPAELQHEIQHQKFPAAALIMRGGGSGLSGQISLQLGCSTRASEKFSTPTTYKSIVGRVAPLARLTMR